jgi:pyruvate formate lyase activating enzyme
MSQNGIEARWWHTDGDRVVCDLCPRACRLRDGQTGFCNARRNTAGRLTTLTYGHPVGLGIDPIEKKPLFHFLPGSPVLSFGTVGCTLACRFCQNWSMSQSDARAGSRRVAPEEILELLRRDEVPSVSYTYNEPTVFAEYLVDVARLARENGIRNVMVSNGYISPQAREEVFAHIDGINVDLKGFSERFYARETRSHLAPVLDTLEWIGKRPDIWLEITTLLIPGLNDSEKMLTEECDWIIGHLGVDVPLHLTAFHPAYQMLDRPRTPPEILQRARDIARGKGLRYVYTGNVADSEGQSTVCPACEAIVIARSGHSARTVGLENGRCNACGQTIAGVFAAD